MNTNTETTSVETATQTDLTAAAQKKHKRAAISYRRRNSLWNFAHACGEKLYGPAADGKISVGDIVELPNPAILEATGEERTDFFIVLFPPKFNDAGILEHMGTGMAIRNADGAGYDAKASLALASQLSKLLKKCASPAGFSSNILPAWGKDYSGQPVNRTDSASLITFLPPELDDWGDEKAAPRAPKAPGERKAKKATTKTAESAEPKATAKTKTATEPKKKAPKKSAPKKPAAKKAPKKSAPKPAAKKAPKKATAAPRKKGTNSKKGAKRV